jgi:hypothetical protein
MKSVYLSGANRTGQAGGDVGAGEDERGEA